MTSRRWHLLAGQGSVVHGPVGPEPEPALIEIIEAFPRALRAARLTGAVVEPSVAKRLVGLEAMSRIDVDPHNWGVAQIPELEAVLLSTLECFETATGIAIIVNIRVKYIPGVPRALDQPDSDGRTVISLSAQHSYWCQYMYQFSHELCHIATNYRQRSPEFCWVDETICVLASWIALRSLANHWKEDPPLVYGKSYSSFIRDYGQERIDEAKGSLDPRPLKQWFQAELSSLRADPIQREKNAKIGLAIMPYFYDRGPGWKAAAKLNTWPVSPGTSVESLFADWMALVAREEASVLQAILGELI